MNKLPEEWIDRLFTRLASMYGQKFTKMWDGIPRQDQVNTWAEMLADMDKYDLANGLKNCIDTPYPPTLPEFRLLCVPRYEPERVFNFAIELRRKRYANYKDYKQTSQDWTMPLCALTPEVIYWAISKLDCSYINAKYADVKNVWLNILSETVAQRKKLEPIPEHLPQIEHKAEKMDKEQARIHLEKLRELLK